MKFKLLGAGIAALSMIATSFAAQAADIPVKGYRPIVSYYNWTGFYAGINAGYGFGTADWITPPPATPKLKGALAGLTFGYNYQVGSIVAGIEGDFDWTSIKGSDNSATGCGTTTPCETKLPWFGTARGRIGYAFDRWLPYVTGGAAIASIKNSGPLAQETKTKVGYTVGGGVEYAFLGNWTTKIEYLYSDLGNVTCTGCYATPQDIKTKVNIIRAGLNYKFSGPLFARY